jgi:hypothetical protein
MLWMVFTYEICLLVNLNELLTGAPKLLGPFLKKGLVPDMTPRAKTNRLCYAAL